MIKSSIHFLFGLLGLEISRKKVIGNLRNDAMISGLKRINNLNLEFKTIVDVGAAQGSWSLSAKEFWPHCDFVLFEPLEERKDELDNLRKSNSKFHIINSAAGNGKSKVNFFVSEDLDGSGVSEFNEISTKNNFRTVEVTSIDIEIAKLNFKGPYLVKLDTHGFEIPILEGCQNILGSVSLFIIECYGFQIAKNSLLFWEMCQYMDKLGFRLYDIVDVMNRSKDGAFWQCDAFFIPRSNSVFENSKYL